MHDIDPKELLTIDEFAHRFSISRSAVYREFKEGNLRKTKVGRCTRIARVDAEAWLALKREGGGCAEAR